MSSKQRNRGRILTPDGLSRLQQAVRTWEVEHEVRCTQERIKELTSTVKEGGLDPGTIRKILKAKDGVDPESIRCLFITFELQLDEADLVPSSCLQIQADPNFVGREGAIGDLNTLINRGANVIVIQARGGVGKTTLARKYLQQEFGSYLEFPIAKETKDIASIESLIEEKLRQLGEEPGREFFVSLDRLKRKLKAMLNSFDITQFHTDDRGAYQRSLHLAFHTVGKTNTQTIERKPLTLRTRIKRLARKTIRFSKSIWLHDVVSGCS